MPEARTVAAGLLVAAMAMQAAFSAAHPREWSASRSIGEPPALRTVTVGAFGEQRSAAYAMTLYLQSFDAQAGQQQRLSSLDHAANQAWLERIAMVAPDTAYPAFLATRIYADSLPPDELRRMLRWVHERFLASPAKHWTSMAHAVYVAGHTLGDKRLAATFAGSLREHGGPDVPPWAKDLELFLLVDLDELQAARMLMGALVASGTLTDPREIEVLTQRLQEIERRQRSDGRHQSAIRP